MGHVASYKNANSQFSFRKRVASVFKAFASGFPFSDIQGDRLTNRPRSHLCRRIPVLFNTRFGPQVEILHGGLFE